MSGIDAVPRRLSAGRRWLRTRVLVPAVFSTLAACEPVLGPMSPLPDNAVAFDPPAGFEAWWAMTEACAARQAHPDGISWYVVPDASNFMTTDGRAVARWSRGTDGSRIVIAGAYIGTELVIRHEMLHALLDVAGHPPEYFVDRCHLTWGSWSG